MNTIRDTFHKSERLCSINTISELFENGAVFHTSLFKVVWKECNTTIQSPARVLFSVSKRNFRLAVSRNLIKRRMREAYRRNKGLLYEQLISENIQLNFAVILKGNSVPDYQKIEKSMKEVIVRLISTIKVK